MCDAHKIGFMNVVKISERVIKKTIGGRNAATANGSMNDAA
jgi:hypothetical protein